MPYTEGDRRADLATILAALRFYQEAGMGEPDNRSDAIHDIAADGDNVISLDDEGIDDLCERLNMGELQLVASEPTITTVVGNTTE